MYKKFIGLFLGLVVALAVSIQPAYANPPTIVIDAGAASNYMNINQTGNFIIFDVAYNGGSAKTFSVRSWMNKGVLLNGASTAYYSAGGVGAVTLTCSDLGGSYRNCSFTQNAGSTITIATPYVARECMTTQTYTAYVYEGTTLQGSDTISYIPLNGTTYTCTIDINEPGYEVYTTMARNTSYYEEVHTNFSYASNTTLSLKYGISLLGGGRNSYDLTGAQYEAQMWRFTPTEVDLGWCGTVTSTVATCTDTQFKSAYTHAIGAWYTTGNTAGIDYKYVNVLKASVLIYQLIIPVTYT